MIQLSYEAIVKNVCVATAYPSHQGSFTELSTDAVDIIITPCILKPLS